MAELVAALGVLSSAATVAELSCSAIGKCLKAIEDWKTRHKFWGNVKLNFELFLRELERAAKAIETAEGSNKDKLKEHSEDWMTIFERSRECCRKLEDLERIWSSRQEEEAAERSKLAKLDPRPVWNQYRLRPQAASLLHELDKARLNISFYYQSISFVLQLRSQDDLDAVKSSLRSMRETASPIECETASVFSNSNLSVKFSSKDPDVGKRPATLGRQVSSTLARVIPRTNPKKGRRPKSVQLEAKDSSIRDVQHLDLDTIEQTRAVDERSGNGVADDEVINSSRGPCIISSAGGDDQDSIRNRDTGSSLCSIHNLNLRVDQLSTRSEPRNSNVSAAEERNFAVDDAMDNALNSMGDVPCANIDNIDDRDVADNMCQQEVSDEVSGAVVLEPSASTDPLDSPQSSHQNHYPSSQDSRSQSSAWPPSEENIEEMLPPGNEGKDKSSSVSKPAESFSLAGASPLAVDLFVRVQRPPPNELPEEIDFLTLLHFMLMANAHGFDEVCRAQAKVWFGKLRETMPTSMTTEFLPWLWMSWMLQLSSEFEALTSIASRESRYRIDSENHHQIQIPHAIVEAIQQRKSKAISKVRSLLLDEISAATEAYSEILQRNKRGKAGLEATTALKKHQSLKTAIRTGYLFLQGQRTGLLGRSDEELFVKDIQDTTVYEGLSFVDVCRNVYAMVDLVDLDNLDNLDFSKYNMRGKHALVVARAFYRMPLHSLSNRLSQFCTPEGLNRGTRSFREWPSNPPTLKQKFVILVQRLESTDWCLRLEDFPNLTFLQ